MAYTFKQLLENGSLRYTAREMATSGCIRWSDKPVPFKGELSSQVYVYAREALTDNPYLLSRLGYLVRHAALGALTPNDRRRQMCLIGIPVAGTALAQAAALSRRDGMTCFRTMREKQKTSHGTHCSWVDGVPDLKKHVYLTVDNTITDGESKFEAFERLTEDGYPVKEMAHIILVDRQQGGVERLRQAGYQVETVFNLVDLVRVFCELDLWPRKRLIELEEELLLTRAP